MTIRTPGRPGVPARIIGIVLLAAYLALGATIVLWPQRVDGDSLDVYRVLYQLYGRGMPRWITYDVVQFAANVVLAAPMAFFLAMILPGRLWWVAALLCSALFGLGEAAQFFLPSRMPSVWDVVANSAGAVIGALLWRGTGGRPRSRRFY
ncbi:VanZ family protein [Microbacterium sp. BK668]|uniref:VanZ family protein n=1 Tax=Microbacterium sp. BK668 TaxID=2512118 RepID=UPI00105F9851|nr:VanZ family protein [Microbacterium sp. BK668]TDN90538.1 VanZ like protein [Microbacterium sp. BK668]